MTSSAKIDWPAKLIETIPLLVGVLITRRFNLHGWRAILAYIAAAGATHQLIEVVESDRVNSHAASVTVKYDIERFTETEIRANLSEIIRLASEPVSDHRPSEV